MAWRRVYLVMPDRRSHVDVLAVSVKPCWGQAVPSVEVLVSQQHLHSFPSALLGHSSQSWGLLLPSHLKIIHINRIVITDSKCRHVKSSVQLLGKCVMWNWIEKLLTETRPLVIHLRLAHPAHLHRIWYWLWKKTEGDWCRFAKRWCKMQMECDYLQNS